MPYIYRVSRREPTNRQPARAGVTVSVNTFTPKVEATPEPEPEPEATEPTYRDIQAQAKALGIPANQTADDLKKAIEEAGNG